MATKPSDPKDPLGLRGLLSKQPEPANDVFGLLAALGEKPALTGVWYHAKSIKLDGYKFVSCRFDKCQLHISSSNFVLDKCIIDADSVIYFGNEILKAVQLYNSRSPWLMEKNSKLAPVLHEDGTISIGA